MSTTPAPRRMSDKEIAEAQFVASVEFTNPAKSRVSRSLQKALSHIAVLDAERAAVAGEAKRWVAELATELIAGSNCVPVPSDGLAFNDAIVEFSATIESRIAPILIDRDRLKAEIETLMTKLEKVLDQRDALRNSPGGEGEKQS